MSWVQTPLIELFERQKILHENVSFNIAFALSPENDLTDVFYYDLKYRVKKPVKNEKRPQRHIIIELFSGGAKSGAGKSTVALSIAWYIMRLNYPRIKPKEFVENYVHFSIANFKEKIKKYNKVGVCHVFDESRSAEYSIGTGSVSIAKSIGDLLSVCRVQGLSAIRIMPHESKSRSLNPHVRINVNKMNFSTGENLSLLQDDELNYRGHIVTSKVENEELWALYEAKKLRFVGSILDDEFDERIKYYQRLVQELVKNEEFKECMNNSERRFLAMEVLGSEIPNNLLRDIIARAVFLLRQENQDKP